LCEVNENRGLGTAFWPAAGMVCCGFDAPAHWVFGLICAPVIGVDHLWPTKGGQQMRHILDRCGDQMRVGAAALDAPRDHGLAKRLLDLRPHHPMGGAAFVFSRHKDPLGYKADPADALACHHIRLQANRVGQGHPRAEM
jgi:hypothetical protein